MRSTFWRAACVARRSCQQGWRIPPLPGGRLRPSSWSDTPRRTWSHDHVAPGPHPHQSVHQGPLKVSKRQWYWLFRNQWTWYENVHTCVLWIWLAETERRVRGSCSVSPFQVTRSMSHTDITKFFYTYSVVTDTRHYLPIQQLHLLLTLLQVSLTNIRNLHNFLNIMSKQISEKTKFNLINAW